MAINNLHYFFAHFKLCKWYPAASLPHLLLLRSVHLFSCCTVFCLHNFFTPWQRIFRFFFQTYFLLLLHTTVLWPCLKIPFVHLRMVFLFFVCCLKIFFVCVRVGGRGPCIHHGLHAEVREQLSGTGLLLPPHGSSGSSSTVRLESPYCTGRWFSKCITKNRIVRITSVDLLTLQDWICYIPTSEPLSPQQCPQLHQCHWVFFLHEHCAVL